MPAGWSPGDRLAFDPSLKRPRVYFAALLSREAVAGKGVQQIPHKEGHAYYVALLTMDGDNLAAALQHAKGLEQKLPLMQGQWEIWVEMSIASWT